MLKSKVSRTIINAYRTANYRIGVPPKDFVFNVRKKSADLNDLMKSHDCLTAAFLTAYNPYGEPAKPHLNVRAQKNLKQDLKETGFVFEEGWGEDPSGRWKKEPSFLVLGISLEAAKALGVKYEQNAIIWADQVAYPELVLLR